MNMLSARDAYRSALPYSPPSQIEERAMGKLAEQNSATVELRSLACRALAEIGRLKFPLGSPIPGRDLEELRDMLLDVTKAGESDPGDWWNEAWDQAREELEEWS